MNKIRIAFFDTKPYDRKYFDRFVKDFGYEVKYFMERLSEESVFLTKGFDVVCAFVNDDLGAPVVEAMEKNGVTLIAMRCAGYNNVDLQAAYKSIPVVRVPAYSPHAVAEHAVALMLSLNRKTHKAYYRTRDNNFNINGFMGFDMYGKTAGVIGTGKIGVELIRILKGFGMTVLAHDPHPKSEVAKEIGFEYVDRQRLFAESDVISLHCPLTKETYHLINDEAIRQMKEKVMIVNTSRGQLIDTKALIEALKTERIGSAGLDVYEEESEYFFEDLSNEVVSDDVLARLLTFNNVLVTSHQAFFTNEAMRNIAHTTVENIKDAFGDQDFPNEICYRCEADQCRKKAKGQCWDRKVEPRS